MSKKFGDDLRLEKDITKIDKEQLESISGDSLEKFSEEQIHKFTIDQLKNHILKVIGFHNLKKLSAEQLAEVLRFLNPGQLTLQISAEQLKKLSVKKYQLYLNLIQNQILVNYPLREPKTPRTLVTNAIDNLTKEIKELPSYMQTTTSRLNKVGNLRRPSSATALTRNEQTSAESNIPSVREIINKSVERLSGPKLAVEQRKVSNPPKLPFSPKEVWVENKEKVAAEKALDAKKAAEYKKAAAEKPTEVKSVADKTIQELQVEIQNLKETVAKNTDILRKKDASTAMRQIVNKQEVNKSEVNQPEIVKNKLRVYQPPPREYPLPPEQNQYNKYLKYKIKYLTLKNKI